jgi:DNA topoisomerase IA
LNKLLIVESPAKSRKIWSLLKSIDPQNTWSVVPSIGHVIDLPYDQLGVDLATFEPQWVVTNKPQLGKIIKEAAIAQEVYLGTDDDREGEAIAAHIRDKIIDKYPSQTFFRIRFHEITKHAIQDAITNPDQVKDQLFEAQIARRCLDRLCGYESSPILWKRVGTKLSAGRVQSCVLKQIVDLELNILRHVSEKFSVVEVCLQDGTKLSSPRITDDAITLSLFEAVKQGKGQLNYSEELIEKKPAPPFTTSSLIQTASKKLHIRSDVVMSQAQQLYDLGLVTYLRTDSIGMNPGFAKSVTTYIETTAGANFSQFRFWKGAGAHECVVEDTIVWTNQGLKTIPNVRKGHLVQSHFGSQEVTDFIPRGKRIVVKITTEHGYEITATKDQEIQVLDKFNQEIVWKRVTDLSKRDFVLIKTGANLQWPEASDLSKFQFKPKLRLDGTPNLSSSCRTLVNPQAFQPKLPSKMTVDLASFLGYIVSEGSIGYCAIEFANSEESILEHYRQCIYKVFGVTHTVDYVDGKTTKIRFGTVEIIQFLEFLGLPANRAGEKEVPWSILESSKEHVVAFLRAYWEGDGSFAGQVSCSSKSKKLIMQIHQLLLRLNIFATRGNYKGGYPSWYSYKEKEKPKSHIMHTLSLYGVDMRTFIETIGYTSLTSRQEVERLQAPHSRRKNQSQRDIVPITGPVRKDCLNTFFRDLPKDHQLKSLEGRYVFDKVVCKEQLQDRQQVFDLTVEKEHCFVANGLVVHNCVRVTDINVFSNTVPPTLADLYSLIWARTAASQAAPAKINHQNVELVFQGIKDSEGKDLSLTGTGDEVIFKGHYQVGLGWFMPKFKAIDKTKLALDLSSLNIHDGQTEPPIRYSEASLIRMMEETGIGRPSTYAATVKKLLDSYYVKYNKSALVPTYKGMILSQFLADHIPELVDTYFTAEMESRLDLVAENKFGRIDLLREYQAWLVERIDLMSKGWVLCFDPCPTCGAELEVTFVEEGEPFLLCPKSRALSNPGIKGLPPSKPGCGAIVSMFVDKECQPRVFVPQKVEGTCVKCKGSIERVSGKWGLYLKCSACGTTQKEA